MEAQFYWSTPWYKNLTIGYTKDYDCDFVDLWRKYSWIGPFQFRWVGVDSD